MMPKTAIACIELSIRSERGIRALAAVAERLAAIVSDQPWNDDAKEAARQIQIAAEELTTRRV